jgi:hypothetical protein
VTNSNPLRNVASIVTPEILVQAADVPRRSARARRDPTRRAGGGRLQPQYDGGDGVWPIRRQLLDAGRTAAEKPDDWIGRRYAQYVARTVADGSQPAAAADAPLQREIESNSDPRGHAHAVPAARRRSCGAACANRSSTVRCRRYRASACRWIAWTTTLAVRPRSGTGPVKSSSGEPMLIDGLLEWLEAEARRVAATGDAAVTETPPCWPPTSRSDTSWAARSASGGFLAAEPAARGR